MIKKAKEIFIKNKLWSAAIIIILALGIILVFWGNTTINTHSLMASILISIGTSLVATTIASIIGFLFKEIDAEKQKKIDNVLNLAGIDAVFAKRDLDDYDCLMQKASKSVDIAGYSMRAFYQSYKEILIDKLKNENLRVRMLFVDPDSDYSKHRNQDEEQTESETYKASVESVVNGLSECPNIEIRKIDNNLGTMIFRIDNVMYIGPYLYKKSSKSTNTFCLNDRGWMFREYQKEFDKMWAEATPYCVEDTTLE